MGTTNKRNSISSVEFLDHICSENKTSSSRTLAPSINFYYLIIIIPSGSDHIKSHITPSWGTSYFLLIVLISSIVLIYGDKPPWTQKILSFTTAANAK